MDLHLIVERVRQNLVLRDVPHETGEEFFCLHFRAAQFDRVSSGLQGNVDESYPFTLIECPSVPWVRRGCPLGGKLGRHAVASEQLFIGESYAGFEVFL